MLLFTICIKEHNHIIKSGTMFNNIDIILFCVYNIKHKERSDIMGRKSIELLPQTMEVLETMGEQIKMARLRRDISAELVAERANISRATF